MRISATNYSLMVIAGLLILGPCASAGDRLRVSEVIKTIPNNWKDAFFSIDVQGASAAGEAILDNKLTLSYEAAVPGYIAYLHISSHGDMSLSRTDLGTAKINGDDTYTVKPPLGTEQIIALFSSAPLDKLFPSGGNFREIGADGPSADAFVRQLLAIEASGIRIATRRYHFTVATIAGGTEYTTRSIEYQVENTQHKHGSAGADTRIPSHIQFEFDSDRLTKQGERDLDQFGEAMVSKIRDNAIVLEGHTDAMGSDEYNMTLSWKRADAARKYLADSFGIPAARMAVDGKGKANPLRPNDTDADRSENRRVDIIFKGQPLSEHPH